MYNFSPFFQGRLGNTLLHEFAVATEALEPPHTYVPWIVIDGDSDEESGELEVVMNSYFGSILI